MVTLIGSVVMWSGYLLVTYGWSQVRGCNIGLRDLAWPGKTIACSPDSGTKATTVPASKVAGKPAAPRKTKKGTITQSGTGPFGRKAVPHPR